MFIKIGGFKVVICCCFVEEKPPKESEVDKLKFRVNRTTGSQKLKGTQEIVKKSAPVLDDATKDVDLTTLI